MTDDEKSEWINGPATMAAEVVGQQQAERRKALSDRIKELENDQVSGQGALGRKCSKCGGAMAHYRLHGYRCLRGC